MKRTILFLGLAFILGTFSSCKKYKNKEVYANVPVYMDYETFRNSFSFEQGVQMENAGNIFVYNNFILVNDIDRGIHVFNNSDPNYPYTTGFMNIPGNTQMAVRDNMLFANSFIDLLIIDISNVNDPKLVHRMKDVFSYKVPMIDEGYPVADIHKDKGVVIDWTIEKTKEVSGFMKKFNVSDCANCEQTELETKSAVTARVSLAGSMSKFAIIDDYLYTLDYSDIKSFNIGMPNAPVFGGTKRTWKEPETLFADGDYLYVGTSTGMMIYDVAADRSYPEHRSTVEHVETCDPVVVQGNYAYITLRSGSNCAGDVNEYQVIDISNKSFPKHEKSFDMYDPHGLAVDGDFLFICDGDDGLKMYSIANPTTSGYTVLHHFPEIKSRDIIVHNGLAIMIAEDGVYQYDYTNPANMHMISALYF